MDSIKGNTDHLKSEFYSLCQFNPRYYKFPGGMPVPVSKKDIPYLHKYYVCDKTDGCRYMLFVTSTGSAYLVDRLMKFYELHVTRETQTKIFSTVLDGELVQCNDGSYIYLVFDVYNVNGVLVKNDILHKVRMNKYITCAKGSITMHHIGVSIELKPKKFYTVNQFDFHNNNEQYKSDGFIFTPMRRKIFHGTDKRTYKWKSPEDHTIDFEFDMENGMNMLYVWDNKLQRVKMCEPVIPNDLYLEGRCIVECRMTKTDNNIQHQWLVYKVRHDKDRPNSMKTYLSTIDIVKENITIQDIKNITIQDIKNIQ